MEDLKKRWLEHYQCTYYLPLFKFPFDKIYPEEKYLVDYSITNDETGSDGDVDHQADMAANKLYFSPLISKQLFPCKHEDERGRGKVGLANYARLMRACKHENERDRGKGKAAGSEKNTIWREWRMPVEKLGLMQLALVTQRTKPAKSSELPLPQQSVKVPVVDLRLYQLGNVKDVAILAYRIATNVPMSVRDGLSFTRLSREAYPSFPEQRSEGKIEIIKLMMPDGKVIPSYEFSEDWDQLRDSEAERKFRAQLAQTRPSQIGSHLVAMMSLFFDRLIVRPRIKSYLREAKTRTSESRQYISVAYSVAGNQLSDENLDRLLSLAAFGDRDGWDNGYAYYPDDVKALLDGQTLDLWRNLGGRYAFTAKVNAYIYNDYYGDFQRFFFDRHIPELYNRMFLLAIAYKTMLYQLDRQVDEIADDIEDSDDTEDDSDRKKKRLEKILTLRKTFIMFTNRHWFEQVTEQLQGDLIFQKQRNALNLPAHYDFVKEQIERSEEFASAMLAREASDRGEKLAKSGQDLARSAEVLAVLGVWLAMFAIIYAVLPWFYPVASSDSPPSLSTRFLLSLIAVAIPLVTLMFLPKYREKILGFIAKTHTND